MGCSQCGVDDSTTGGRPGVGVMCSSCWNNYKESQ